jgi:hypothetical protein
MRETSREAVRRLVREQPTWNLSRIADEVGVSRERVRQLVKAEGLAPPRGVVGYRRRDRPPVARLITGGVAVRITHAVAGTIGELLVAADLLARGYQVYAPITRHGGACDLITLREGLTECIEVRCGARNARGVVKYNRPDTAKSDRRAIVLTGEPVLYDPPFPNSGH